MNPESYIKSSIANLIVSLMLKEAGLEVIPLKNNDTLDRLSGGGVDKDETAKLLFNIPGFIVINNKKKPILVSVKYKGENKTGRNVDWGYRQMSEYWPGTSMIVVTNNEPYFMVSGKEGMLPISNSAFKINKKTSDKYACLVRKFLQS